MLNFDLILGLDYDEINHKQSESCILNTIYTHKLSFTNWFQMLKQFEAKFD